MATIEQFQERLRLAVREALQKVLVDGGLPEPEGGRRGSPRSRLWPWQREMPSAWKCSSSSWWSAAWGRRTVLTAASRGNVPSSANARCKRDAAWKCR